MDGANPRPARPLTRVSGIASALAAALAALVLTGACAAPGEPRPASDFLSRDAVVLELPVLVQDEMYSCGLVALSALCRYDAVPVPEAESRRLAELARERHGLSGGEVRDALQRLGFEVFLYEGALDRGPAGAYSQIDAGRPLIVMLSPDGEHHHYALLLGYDEPRGTVCLLDPARGQVLLPVAAFERDWARARHFTLLAVPRARAPIEVTSS